VDSKRKGKRGELEFAAVLRAEGFQARRGQQFSGSPDSPDGAWSQNERNSMNPESNKPEALPAIGCSAFLALMDTTDRHLLICAWGLVMLVCLYGLWVCASVLLEHYSGLYQSYREKRKTQQCQNPSQPNDTAGRNLGKLGNQNGNLSLTLKDGVRVKCGCPPGRGIRNILTKCVNSILKFFSFTYRA
jgi:hypothetical protein